VGCEILFGYPAISVMKFTYEVEQSIRLNLERPTFDEGPQAQSKYDQQEVQVALVVFCKEEILNRRDQAHLTSLEEHG
jgi:hypothetical protein